MAMDRKEMQGKESGGPAGFMEQLELWNQEDEYQRIIDEVEALPEEEKTPEIMGQLARAYNNLAQPGDNHLFWRAVELLLSVEDVCSGEADWNFRMGYAYYYLDQEDRARMYFKAALELAPGDEDTVSYIEECNKSLSLPTHVKPFSRRASDGWESFLKGEGKLREMIAAGEHGDEIVELCKSLLEPAFEDICFEIGGVGEPYDLILTPGGDRVKMFQLVYFKNQMPEEVLKHWNVYVGRQPSENYVLRMFGQDLSATEAWVWVETLEDRQVGLSVYCEKLLPLLRDSEGQAYSVMAVLLDQILGEAAAMRYIGYMDLLEAPQEGDHICLDSLREYIEEKIALGSDPHETTADELCEYYTAYTMEPSDGEDWYLRQDVFAGVTTCYPLLKEYYEGEERIMDCFHHDGVVPGFFYYSLEGIERDKILDLRDQAKQMISDRTDHGVTFIGGASGTEFGYLDFIAWDLKAVLDAAVEVFALLPVKMAAFHSFRRDVRGIGLKRTE